MPDAVNPLTSAILPWEISHIVYGAQELASPSPERIKEAWHALPAPDQNPAAAETLSLNLFFQAAEEILVWAREKASSPQAKILAAIYVAEEAIKVREPLVITDPNRGKAMVYEHRAFELFFEAASCITDSAEVDAIWRMTTKGSLIHEVAEAWLDRIRHFQNFRADQLHA